METQTGKVLITGATGLVGQRLVKRLLEAGYNCNALVRKGKHVTEGITAIAGDLFDPESLTSAVKDVTAVIHLAAVFRSNDTGLIWKSNLEGTNNLISALKAQAPDARFIMASTAHVYNANNPHPGKEDDYTDPQHAYPASKLAAEKSLRESGLNWSILRFPFVYGDGDGHLEELPKHVIAAKWHPAMKISTVHHRDIANAMKMALQGVMDKQIINITDDATLSIYELLKINDVTMESSSEPLLTPWYLHIDGSRARMLGFKASVRTVYQAVQENLL